MSEVVNPRSWVIYGRSGTGKTTLASTFPKPLLLVDVNDQGTDSIQDVKDVHVMEPETPEELDDLYWYLKENSSKFKTVVIDTVSQVQQMKVDEVGGSKAARTGRSPGDWGVMTKQDWGEVSSWMKSWITNMRNLPMEVVFIAQDRVFNVEDESEDSEAIDPEVGPRLMPSVNSHLCAAVHMVGNTFIRDKVTKKKVKGKEVENRTQEYSIRLGPNPYYITKLRKPRDIVVPAFLEDPNYEDILEIIKGE